MGGGVTVIDPPVGQAFRQPALIANESSDPGIVEVALEARRAAVDVNGAIRQPHHLQRRASRAADPRPPRSAPADQLPQRAAGRRRDQLPRSPRPDDERPHPRPARVAGRQRQRHALGQHDGDARPGREHGLRVRPLEASGGQSQLLPPAHPRQRVRPDVGRPVGAARRRGRGAGAVRLQREGHRPQGHHAFRLGARRPRLAHGLHARARGRDRHGQRAGQPAALDRARTGPALAGRQRVDRAVLPPVAPGPRHAPRRD